MASYMTRTKELGGVTFVAPAATDAYAGYVWLETESGDRRQICHGGDFRGDTVTATSGELIRAARAWMTQRRRWMTKEGL